MMYLINRLDGNVPDPGVVRSKCSKRWSPPVGWISLPLATDTRRELGAAYIHLF